jgi:hypothetical protein
MYEYDAAPSCIGRHHCCNKEVVSVGTHLNFYYIHDSFFNFLFLFLLIAGGILRRTCPLVCLYVMLLVIKTLGIKRTQLKFRK